MGEIGMPRREFLYDISFWEVRRIIRGYRRRDRLKHQLMAECVYAATFAMRNPEGKKVTDMFPSLFEEDDEPAEMMSEEDKAELLELMANMNKRERQ